MYQLSKSHRQNGIGIRLGIPTKVESIKIILKQEVAEKIQIPPAQIPESHTVKAL